MGRFGLPARTAPAVILAALVLPLTSVGALAKGAVTLTVHAGYQDVIKPGEWMPVTIDASNSGAGVDGTLEVQQSLNAQPGVSGTTIYQEAISLAAGASKRVRIYLVEDTTGATITARVVQNGRVVVSQDAASTGTTTTLIGVLSDQASSLDEFAAIHPGGVAARVVHLRPEEIADSPIPLRAFDLLAIDDFATDSLTSAQRAALAGFVSNGGDLLLGTGAAWHKTLAGLPAALLPMQVSGTALVNVPDLGTSAVELATGTVTGGQAWLAHGAQPLLLDRSVGAGTVTMATFDWNQDPVAGWSGAKDLQRQIMARAIFGSGGAGQNFTYGFVGGGPAGFGSVASMASKSNALMPVLANLPGLDLPSLQLTGALVLLYVLLVGPVNYLVLGAIRRRALAWVTVPLIAIVAAGGAYGTGVVTKGRSVQANEIAILHLQPGADQAYQETYVGIIPPGRGDYQARVAGERLLISPIATNNNGFGYNPGGIRVDVAGNGVTMTGMTAFSLGGFATEGMAAAPSLTGHLRLSSGTLTGTVENHSNVAFTDAVLIAGDNFQKIGPLKPGATATISVTPKSVNLFGQPLFTRVYANGVYCGGGPCGPYGSSSDRDTTAKTQILSLLPTTTSFKGNSAPITPMLVGWTHQPFESLTVGGGSPRSYAETAVVLSLPVDRIDAGTLPAGLVNGRIVDVVGDSQGNAPQGMLLIQKGSVTYDFVPPLAAGAHLTGVSVNAQNPYGPKFGPPSGSTQTGPAVQGQVWDWGRSAWTDIAYQDNGTTALPDRAVNPNTGLVRLRLTTSVGGLLAGGLSLSGIIE